MERRILLTSLLIIAALIISCSTAEGPTDTDVPIQSQYKLENIEFKSRNYIKVQSGTYKFIVIFELDGKSLNYNLETSRKGFPIILMDDQGGDWNVFGECVSGPYIGTKLKPAAATSAYWFSWINLFKVYRLNGQVKENEPFDIDDPGWNIPTKFVNEGAKFDAIPSIDNPVFDLVNFKEALIDYDFLKEDDKVIVVSLNGETKVYPIKILDHHEIVNDIIADVPIVVSYAPYTGSPSVHLRTINGQQRSFGVSGQIYMNNMLMFDRESGSIWSQLLNRAVAGSLINTELGLVSFILTDWAIWMNAANEYLILSEDQGFDLDYRTPKFDNYIARDSFLPFEVPVIDDSQLNKALFFGLGIDEEVMLFESPN